MDLKIMRFQRGDVYLFHPTDAFCNPDTSLWGVFGKLSPDGSIRLETASHDLRHFLIGMPLPKGYMHCRQATRNELRDYYFNLISYRH